MQRTRLRNDYVTLLDIVSSYKARPKECVIHIRLGDVLKTSRLTEIRMKRPVAPTEIARIVDEQVSPAMSKTIMYATHLGYESQSDEYASIVADNIENVQLSKNGDPDDDFVDMVHCDLFVAGRGGFSELVVMLRKKLKKETVEHPLLSGYVLRGRAYRTDPTCQPKGFQPNHRSTRSIAK